MCSSKQVSVMISFQIPYLHTCSYSRRSFELPFSGVRARVDRDDMSAAAAYLILSYLCRRTERGKWASRDTGPMSLGRYLIDA